MNMYDINCPLCGKVIVKSSLTGGKSAQLCSTCKIRFDVKVTSQSPKTGEYYTVNVRKA